MLEDLLEEENDLREKVKRLEGKCSTFCSRR